MRGQAIEESLVGGEASKQGEARYDNRPCPAPARPWALYLAVHWGPGPWGILYLGIVGILSIWGILFIWQSLVRQPAWPALPGALHVRLGPIYKGSRGPY